MKCFMCGSEMKPVKTTYSSKWGDYEVAIKNVDALRCEQCQETIFAPDVARMIQNITKGLAESPSTIKPDFLNLDEVAEMLRVSNQTVYNMIKDGRLTAVKAGREWRFRTSDVMSALQNTRKISVAARGDKFTPGDIEAIKDALASDN